MPAIERESARDSGPLPRSAEDVKLTAIEAAIRDANDIEEWYRDQLVTEAWSLREFYRRHTSG